MGVPEKILHLQDEAEKPQRFPDAKRYSPPEEVQELDQEAKEEMDAAGKFLEDSGIRLALFEFNQDLLNNRGRVKEEASFRYRVDEESESLIYHSSVLLSWRTQDRNYYTLIAQIEGDLLDTFPVDDEGREVKEIPEDEDEEDYEESYRKRLTLSLFHSRNPDEKGRQIGQTIEFGGIFDIWDTERSRSTSVTYNLNSEEEYGAYHSIEKKEGTQDFETNLFKDWVESNIAGFISYARREQSRDIVS